MNFKDFIKENEKDFLDYVEVKKQVNNLGIEISKIKVDTMTRTQIEEGEITAENEKDIERIDQQIDEIEKQIIEINSSHSKKGLFYKIFNKDKYNAEADKLSSLDIERERLNKEKSRIEKICIAREEGAKAKEQISEIEWKIDLLKSDIDDRKQKLIELIGEQISDNLLKESMTLIDKEEKIKELNKEIKKLQENFDKLQLLKIQNSSVIEPAQSKLNNKICEKEEYEKKVEQDLKVLNMERKLYENLKTNINDGQIVKELLCKVLGKTEENKDKEVKIFDKNYSVDQSTGFIEMQGKNNGEDRETLNQVTRLDKAETSWYYGYIDEKRKEEGDNSTIITDREFLKFNESGRYNNEDDGEREAI